MQVIWLTIYMLYMIFTVDGDWKEYFEIKLREEERIPRKDILQSLIQREIEVAGRILDGKFIHFIHTSSRARNFFLDERFLKLWKEIIEKGGDVGLHCHEDDPYKDYYYEDSARMRDVISKRVGIFREKGLSIRCYRSGFLGFSKEMVGILEKNKVQFDFSCEPGRFLTHEKTVVCDWRGAPESLYKMSYEDHCKRGDSRIFEVPVGVSKGKYLYFEKSNLRELERIASDLKKKSIKENCDIIVSVLAHTYDFASLKDIKLVEKKLGVLKKFGSFINLNELIHTVGEV